MGGGVFLFFRRGLYHKNRAFRIAIFERHSVHTYIDVFDNILYTNVDILLLLTMLMPLDEKFFANFFSGFQTHRTDLISATVKPYHNLSISVYIKYEYDICGMFANTTYMYVFNKFSEPLRIAGCTVRINDFVPRAAILFSRMMTQGGNKASPIKQLKKAFHPYRTAFQTFGKIHDNINIRIMKKTW